MKMVEAALIEAGLDRSSFDIVPFPIGRPELIGAYIPRDACLFVTILDQWGHCKAQRLREHGYDVNVLWERDQKGISSSMIRRLISEYRPWAQLVPPATYRYILSNGIDARIKRMCRAADGPTP